VDDHPSKASVPKKRLGEDAKFYSHKGLDYIAIVRALLKNLFSGELVQGESTITQQVVKSLLLSSEKSLKRKIREAILALRIEKNLSKEEILFLYLNQIYLGHGAYGVAAAAETYFDKKIEQLNLSESALLARLTQASSKCPALICVWSASLKDLEEVIIVVRPDAKVRLCLERPGYLFNFRRLQEVFIRGNQSPIRRINFQSIIFFISN
jgi:hypothetical protein